MWERAKEKKKEEVLSVFYNIKFLVQSSHIVNKL